MQDVQYAKNTGQFMFKPGMMVQVQRYVSNHNRRDRVIILLPAIGVAVSKYSRLVEQLLSQGFDVVTADYPGCGENRPLVSRSYDYNYADLLQHFIPKLIERIPESLSQPPVLLGHSLGGHLASLYASKTGDTGPAGTGHQVSVIAVASGNISHKNWQGRARFSILSAAVLFRSMVALYGYFPGRKVGFGNREAGGIMRDWCTTVFTGNYRHIIAGYLPSMQKNLFIHMQGDDWAPLASTRHLAELFVQPQLITLDPPADLKGNAHSSWIKQPGFVVDKIVSYLEDGRL
ncbi:alpha/beta fold hydrolase [Alkanindiges sp. WGS2144]|uniref:alpha/beta fold hydrolase n=1 Tax=Alkanindiges sp. WGS2144 TaxID=3366808 RepID=UPI003752FF44